MCNNMQQKPTMTGTARRCALLRAGWGRQSVTESQDRQETRDATLMHKQNSTRVQRSMIRHELAGPPPRKKGG